MVGLFLPSQEQPQQIHLQNPIFENDVLYCQEENFDEEEDDFGGGLGFLEEIKNWDVEITHNNKNKNNFALLENDLFSWEDQELVSLLCKEKENHFEFGNLVSDGSLLVARKEGVQWMLRVIAHYGFTPKTGVLAVNYYDRFVSSICFQRDKPWMSQLIAVACLSIAAKVEEVQVPLLIDLQVQDSKFMFEAKTIQRMELLVLSSLKWKMNLVTPLSFIDHIVRRFRLMINLNWEFLNRCEQLLLSIVTDVRLVHYLPSEIATSTMLFVIKDFGPCEVMQYQNQVMDALKVSKEKVNECYKLILELMDDDQGLKHRQGFKRKLESIPSSPNGVIDTYFSCDSSNDSWDVGSKTFKRSRVQEKLMISS